MLTSTERTAILVFSRTATEEAAAKSFVAGSGKNRNKAIADALIRHTLRTARRAQLPVFLSPGSGNGDFGACLADAIESIFQRGYTRVITIGNDCPALSVGHLVGAAQQLDTVSVVLGPAADGGAYLIGLRRSAYRRAAFVGIDWQTPLVAAQLTNYAAGDFYCLDKQRDVDCPDDLAVVLRTVALPVFLRIRLLFLTRTALSGLLSRAGILPRPVFTAAPVLRGPPRLQSLSCG